MDGRRNGHSQAAKAGALPAPPSHRRSSSLGGPTRDTASSSAGAAASPAKKPSLAAVSPSSRSPSVPAPRAGRTGAEDDAPDLSTAKALWRHASNSIKPGLWSQLLDDVSSSLRSIKATPDGEDTDGGAAGLARRDSSAEDMDRRIAETLALPSELRKQEIEAQGKRAMGLLDEHARHNTQSAKLIGHLEDWLAGTAQKFEDAEGMSSDEAEEAGRASALVGGMLNQQGALGLKMRQVVHSMATKAQGLEHMAGAEARAVELSRVVATLQQAPAAPAAPPPPLRHHFHLHLHLLLHLHHVISYRYQHLSPPSVPTPTPLSQRAGGGRGARGPQRGDGRTAGVQGAAEVARGGAHEAARRGEERGGRAQESGAQRRQGGRQGRPR